MAAGYAMPDYCRAISTLAASDSFLPYAQPEEADARFH